MGIKYSKISLHENKNFCPADYYCTVSPQHSQVQHLRISLFADFKTAKKINPIFDSMYGKEALRSGDWSTAARVLRFQTIAPDWSTGPDMSRRPLSC
ncbi:hypothetical protein T11_14680 [Trichinella zimbabwensis]|uniref:Uncharacterized protein n=1 Tax=Trichinella zimbabwensis TaxID=268475 RepID=A0A0V1GR41_9BILA|nr:hypothetical protein T11_12248 [Trichinella zimbabwensis]KRZ00569.1 hypothetical protein T11_14680 [Trichinella zimbabwensis]